jgi:hypothetical protein
MTHRRIARVVFAVLLAAAPAAAHRSSFPECFTSPPPRNAEGPPEEDGFWEPIVDIGQQAIHAVHLPTGKILVWGYNNQGIGVNAKLFDPDTSVATETTVPTEAFCAGQTYLPDGRVIIAGGLGRRGSISSVTYDPFTDTWGPIIPMYAGRFYPTLTTLADGRVFTASGSGSRASTPEIYDPMTLTWTPLGCDPFNPSICRDARFRWHFYARTTQTPDERLFVVPASREIYAATFDLDTEQWTVHAIGTGRNGKLTPAPAVYYDVGKLLRAGNDVYAPKSRATADASVLDISDSLHPTYRTITPMVYPRNRNNLTILADGKVLATGGLYDPNCEGQADVNVYHPELWDPATEQWETLGPMQEARHYHSTALLLRDGSIMVAGGETKKKTLQIFHPPYLYKGPRPVIDSAPATIDVAPATFDVFTLDAATVAQVNLLKLGAVTHAYDENQRIVKLNILTRDVNKITVGGPTNNYYAPPGYYMLFLISDLGVPSISNYVRVTSAEWN